MSGHTDTQRGDPADFPRSEVSAGYEPSDWPTRKVGLTVIGLAALPLFTAALVAIFFLLVGRPVAPGAGSVDAQPIGFPRPRLQADETVQRRVLEGVARAHLAGAGGHTSIDAAMRATLATGWRNPGAPVPSPAETVRRP